MVSEKRVPVQFMKSLDNFLLIEGLPTSYLILLLVLPEDLIHLRDLVQYEGPSPDDSWAGWSVMLAIQVSAEHGNQQHRLLQGWGLLWRVPGMVRMAIQCLPFDGLQQYFTRQIAVDSCQQGRVQDAPTDDGKQGGGSYESLEVTELARLDTTAAFQHAMPGLNRPTSRIPGQSLENIINNWLLVFRGHRICL